MRSIILAITVAILSSCPVFAKHSNDFNPLPISIQSESKSAGVPVGTIIVWPVSINPVDMDNWLECNGQSITQAQYPELYAIVGSSVPDYRGLFLRGVGGNSAALGIAQGDAIRNVTGNFHSAWLYNYGGYTGAFYQQSQGYRCPQGYPLGGSYVGFNLSRVVPTASENRPVNKAVRYLIRARS